MTPDTLHVVFIVVELAAAVCVFIILFFISAPYGRHFRKGWGITVSERFAWMLMESPALLLVPVFFLAGGGFVSVVPIVYLLLWELHYFQRTIVYPLMFPENRKVFPLVVAFMAFVFNIVNGCVQGLCLFIVDGPPNAAWLIDPRFLVGTVLFITGYAVNLGSDKILRALRTRNGAGVYSVPHGGMFRYVSCPNYFGEIVEWIGWAVLTWSFAGATFALFTIANLFPRAISNHRWYREQFPDYPKERKAIIPFIV
jgi:3-oxo-5-alpha-steroid 4-dehydrogenase 1